MTDNRDSELRQLVVFRLGNGEFGADIRNVREIIRIPDITSVPTAPSVILGVINLRGATIPILSLGQLFNGVETEIDSDTRVLVIDSDGREVGLVVDGVSEVLRLEDGAITEPPQSLGASAAYYVDGIARFEERLVLIVNMSHLVETGADYETVQGEAA